MKKKNIIFAYIYDSFKRIANMITTINVNKRIDINKRLIESNKYINRNDIKEKNLFLPITNYNWKFEIQTKGTYI